MGKAVYIVDYIGNSNEHNRPIGHPVKVIKDYVDLLGDDLELTLVLPSIYSDEFSNTNKIKKIVWLNRWSQITTKRLLQKIRNIFSKLENIKQIANLPDCDNIWFINTDFYLGIGFILYKKYFKGKNIIVTMYIDSYNGNDLRTKTKNYLLEATIKNASTVILSTNKVLESANNRVYIPDYYYCDKIYSKYKNLAKENKVVCVGTMNEGKDLENLIATFNELNIGLQIVGSFFDQQRFRDLNSIKNDNIKIEDKVLNADEYYSLIASSKYVIVPYKNDHYNNRSSGVLAEAMFLNSIPIAPKFLLETNKINGIAYSSLSDLISLLNDEISCDAFEGFESSNSISESYLDKNVKDKIMKILK